MTKAKELLLQCKIKKGIQSDYKLAQALNIDRARVSDYMNEKRTPDEFACVQIALILGKDPIEIISEIQAETEKNEKRRQFWKDFLQRIKGTGTLWATALIFTGTLLLAPRANAATLDTHNVYYVKLVSPLTPVAPIYRKQLTADTWFERSGHLI